MKSIKKIIEAAKMKGKDPCWKGYQMVGTKNKNGKEVPNCVPEEVQQEGAVPSGESVITVKHRTSGKTLRISANAAAKYRAMGYHFHPTNESVEQIDELSNDTLKSYLQKSKDQEGTGLGRQGAGAKHQYSYENSQNGKRNAINRLDARQGKIGKYGVVPKVPGYNKEEVEQIEEIYSVKHDGVDANHPDKDVARLFTNKKNVINHVTRYKDSAESRAKLLKGKGFKNVRIEEVEQIEELSNATLRGYADKARADIQKTLPKLHTDPKAAGRVEKRISGLAASTVAKVKNNMKSEEVESIDEISSDLAGKYMDKVADNQMKQHGLQKNLYSKLPAKRQAGVDRALERMRVKESVNVKKTTDSDGGVPTEAAQTLATNGQPTQTKNNGQTKMSAYVFEGQMKRLATDKEEDERLAKQKGSWKVETPWKKVKSDVVVDKSGAKHTPMSRARDLARKAFSKNVNEQENIQPNPFTVPSVNPGQAPKKPKSRQMDIVREARNNAMKKKKEVTEAGSDKFQPDPELTSQITKSNP